MNPYHTLAYLDPGSGTMLLQLLLAGLAVSGIAIATGWRYVRAFFRSITGKFRKEPTQDS